MQSSSRPTLLPGVIASIASFISRAGLFTVMRFVVAGIAATGTNLVVFYILAHVMHVWYVLVTPLAYLIAFGVSFILQKYWTFRNREKNVLSQTVRYFIVVTVNLFFNSLLVYVMVEFAHLYDVWAQALASLIIAVESFFIYRLIFRSHPDAGAAEEVAA